MWFLLLEIINNYFGSNIQGISWINAFPLLYFIQSSRILGPPYPEKVAAAAQRFFPGCKDLKRGCDVLKKIPDKITEKSVLREYAEAIIIALLLAFFIRTFVVQAFKIPSGSMIPTLLIGDHILVNKFGYGVKNPLNGATWIAVGEPHRHDVIVFKYPQNPSQDFIKRVVGVAGDRIEIVRKKVFVNGEPFVEPNAVNLEPEILPSPGITWTRSQCLPTLFLSWEIIGITATTADFGDLSTSRPSGGRLLCCIGHGIVKILGCAGIVLAN